MRIGYARQTRRGLTLEYQVKLMLADGIEDRHIYRDVTRDLSARLKAMRSLRRGDEFVTASLATLAPNEKDMLDAVHTLVSKGVKVRVLAGEPITYLEGVERFCRDLADAKRTWKSEAAADPTRRPMKRTGRPTKFGLPGSDRRMTLLAWWKSDMTNSAFEQVAGVSARRARQIFGERPAIKGRPVRKVK